MNSGGRDAVERSGERVVWVASDGLSPGLVPALLSCLAEAMETDVEAAGTVLDEAIDSVVFERVYTQIYDGSARFEGRVTFPVGEFEVTITTDGRIEVTPSRRGSGPVDDASTSTR
ncbi:HalOD1 output domain-containing protein [Halomarina salina]|uniref:HalOD1 output domain-containing protein n=1 Tax=Halomarina salina TaxID=1872699 RepID=A0ABD5RLP3_9EURY|nr:HalOD1 output domain-containing protein [Halomarina salina]